MITPKVVNGEMDCLTTISLSACNRCNKQCSYCPHGHGYSCGGVELMTIKTAKTISARLKALKKKPRVTISGMGEPFLNPQLFQILKILQEFSPTIITNGTVQPEWAIGIDNVIPVVVSVHDKNELNMLKKMWPQATFRDHDPSSSTFELHTTNRDNFFETSKVYSGQCYCPFYKLVIDCDGAYLKCAEEWVRNPNIEYRTVYDLSIQKYFTEALKSLKNKLILGRNNVQSCKHCDIDGTLIGREVFDWYVKNR